MPEFSAISKARLLSCHPDLQRLFNEVIKYRDCSILVGHRGQQGQDEAYRTGHSNKKWPSSKHNQKPAMATDAMPYFDEVPHIRWPDELATYEFTGYVQATADQLGIDIRSGADWDEDLDFYDQTLDDGAHYGLVRYK